MDLIVTELKNSNKLEMNNEDELISKNAIIETLEKERNENQEHINQLSKQLSSLQFINQYYKQKNSFYIHYQYLYEEIMSYSERLIQLSKEHNEQLKKNINTEDLPGLRTQYEQVEEWITKIGLLCNEIQTLEKEEETKNMMEKESEDDKFMDIEQDHEEEKADGCPRMSLLQSTVNQQFATLYKEAHVFKLSRLIISIERAIRSSISIFNIGKGI